MTLKDSYNLSLEQSSLYKQRFVHFIRTIHTKIYRTRSIDRYIKISAYSDVLNMRNVFAYLLFKSNMENIRYTYRSSQSVTTHIRWIITYSFGCKTAIHFKYRVDFNTVFVFSSDCPVIHIWYETVRTLRSQSIVNCKYHAALDRALLFHSDSCDLPRLGYAYILYRKIHATVSCNQRHDDSAQVIVYL